MIMSWLEPPEIPRKMLSVKLKADQTIHDLIDMIESYKKFKRLDIAYTIEFNRAPNYVIECYDKILVKYIKEHCHTNTIHRNEDR
jgi:hypothetical protein